MQLLLQRGQRRTKILNRPIFTLWAKFELTSEEESLINKYEVRNYTLDIGNPLQIIRVTQFSIPFGILGYAIVISQQGILIALAFGFFVYGMSIYVIYDLFREEVRIRDILDDRFFACKSVVLLTAKEQNIAKMANAFRHLLEAMKNWGGKEIIKLEPYKEPALKVIEGPHASV